MSTENEPSKAAIAELFKYDVELQERYGGLGKEEVEALWRVLDRLASWLEPYGVSAVPQFPFSHDGKQLPADTLVFSSPDSNRSIGLKIALEDGRVRLRLGDSRLPVAWDRRGRRWLGSKAGDDAALVDAETLILKKLIPQLREPKKPFPPILMG